MSYLLRLFPSLLTQLFGVFVFIIGAQDRERDRSTISRQCVGREQLAVIPRTAIAAAVSTMPFRCRALFVQSLAFSFSRFRWRSGMDPTDLYSRSVLHR